MTRFTRHAAIDWSGAAGERVSLEQGLASPCSNFNLVGAAQAGKSSLTGMRVFHRLDGRVPVSPFDALARLGSRPHAPLARYTDHATDALLASRRPDARARPNRRLDLRHPLAVRRWAEPG